MSDYLLWCDLETTGLDFDKDEILEAAFALTDIEGKTDWIYQSVLIPSQSAWHRMNDNPIVMEMHQKSGLWDLVLTLVDGSPLNLPHFWWEVTNVHSVSAFSESVVGMIRRYVGKDDTLYLAGSGIARFDRHMLARFAPEILAELHYREVDLSNIRTMLELTGNNDFLPPKPTIPHRAMDDLQIFIGQYRTLLANFNLAREAFKKGVS